MAIDSSSQEEKNEDRKPHPGAFESVYHAAQEAAAGLKHKAQSIFGSSMFITYYLIYEMHY